MDVFIKHSSYEKNKNLKYLSVQGPHEPEILRKFCSQYLGLKIRSAYGPKTLNLGT